VDLAKCVLKGPVKDHHAPRQHNVPWSNFAMTEPVSPVVKMTTTVTPVTIVTGKRKVVPPLLVQTRTLIVILKSIVAQVVIALKRQGISVVIVNWIQIAVEMETCA
jgi:hypothetical protein